MRVLVVDDDVLIQRLLTEELEEDGYNVSIASNGKEAISVLINDSKKPDLVILDLRMPDMNGLETMGHILKLKFEIPVIIFSAYNSYRNDSFAMAADAYVVKSSDLSELKKKIYTLGQTKNSKSGTREKHLLSANKKSGGNTIMSIKKQSKKSKSVYKVTFILPKEVVNLAKDIHLVGEFNSWDIDATPMKKQKDGSFSVTLNLEPGHEYQYRYLIDGTKWVNDLNADKYIVSPFGDSKNSVIVL